MNCVALYCGGCGDLLFSVKCQRCVCFVGASDKMSYLLSHLNAKCRTTYWIPTHSHPSSSWRKSDYTVYRFKAIRCRERSRYQVPCNPTSAQNSIFNESATEKVQERRVCVYSLNSLLILPRPTKFLRSIAVCLRNSKQKCR